MGCDLDDPLWSAHVLLDDPELIRRVHLEFLEAGADCIATASYQATPQGFGRRGLAGEQARALLDLSVALAVEARDRFWRETQNRTGRLRPLVAASVGPYGAFLADGSEYTGAYGLSERELYEFHRERWQILAGSAADLLACETIPSRLEVEALLRLLSETPETWAWISLSCADAAHLADGSEVSAVAAACEGIDGVAAVAVNCISPFLVDELIIEVRKGTRKPILVYPNSGERYIPSGKVWTDGRAEVEWASAARRWVGRGAVGVGGCCRVGAETIRTIRQALLP